MHAVSIMFPIATKAMFLAAPTDEGLMHSTIASILSGAVFGDHVTPISDTTILSAIASRSALCCACTLGPVGMAGATACTTTTIWRLCNITGVPYSL